MAFPMLAVRHRLPAVPDHPAVPVDRAGARCPDPVGTLPGAPAVPPGLPPDVRRDGRAGDTPARLGRRLVLPLPPGTAVCLVCLWNMTGGAEDAAMRHTRTTGHPTISRPLDPALPDGGDR